MVNELIDLNENRVNSLSGKGSNIQIAKEHIYISSKIYMHILKHIQAL